MKIKRHLDAQMGDAISMEDAISMLTIIFVLFVIFLVPLISIDKAKLEQAKKDVLWQTVIDNWRDRSQNISQEVIPYVGAFGLDYHVLAQKSIISGVGKPLTYYEFIDADSSLIIITHETSNQEFSLMRMSSHGGSTIFRHGLLGWSSNAREWFIIEESNDYGETPKSLKLLKRYRDWYTKKAGSK